MPGPVFASARRGARAVTFASGRFREVVVEAHVSAVETNILAADMDGMPGDEVAYGLADDTVVVWVFRR